ncbi:hypothetical protein N7447_005838 [Penicillium robsamsonii]|uniref:uncharacterized protein n=1 Tax=Penicillium robsamsonii TaxID=1792511 RepID=UPI002546C948|nr:uncharacterized protein N7447_005838 [Penicillium robsamsonii]KAJ5823498.1 hypothetical protein N7447_005838 [Penicillium robsamsonii]
MLSSFTTLTLSLLLANLATGTIIDEDEPQLFANVSRVNTDDGFSLFSGNASLNTRDRTCGIGYTTCDYDTSRCCSLGQKCCGNGFCAMIGETCCTGGGTCPIGFKCCSGTDGCAPLGGECCSDGYYCRMGKKCRTWKGKKVCCSSVFGCAGENDGVGSDDGIESGDTTVDVTSTTTTKSTTTTEPTTTTYVQVDWEYYYTTIYWTYWFYYWTSFAPYTVQTVTSTRTSTQTVWSVYATNSAVATSSFEDRSSSYTYFPPYSATSLKSSSEPVTLSSATATAGAGDDVTGSGSSIGGTSLDPGLSAAVSVGVSGTGILAAVLVAIVGGLAFAL